MSDLIKRSEAITEIKEYANNHTFNSFYKGMLKACEILAQLPSADGSQEWIPTCDRLPSDSDYYLVTLIDAFGDTEICIAWYAHEKDYSGETGWREITDSDFVTAWMPLPKPYKGVDDNRDYERSVEQMEYDMLYEPTYNPEDGSM